MSFPRYPRYKDSGVEWLGEVPEHWDIRPLWTYFRRVKRVGHADAELLSVYRDHGVIPKASRDDNFNNPSDDLDAYQLVEPGDLVINKMKAWQGSVAVSDHRGIVSPAYFVYGAVHTDCARYLHYLMRSPQYTAGYLSLSKGIRVGQWDLQPEYHSRMPVVRPPLDEQVAVATFLDGETKKIDALVAEQQRLIEVLKEKRQAVISHAVTRGLDPDAPMKPSGVEWLGDVPAHWTLCLLKRVFRTMDYGISNSLEPIGAVAVLRMGNIAEGRIKVDELKYVDAVDSALLLSPGDLLYNRTNSLDQIAKVGLYEGSVDMPVSFASYLVRLRTHDEVLPEYMMYSLNTSGMLGIARASAFVAIGQCNLNPSRYGEIPVVIPPRNEQKAIVEFLGQETRSIDRLIAEADSAILLLRELRTALISAAVTGKIDVRGIPMKEAA